MVSIVYLSIFLSLASSMILICFPLCPPIFRSGVLCKVQRLCFSLLLLLKCPTQVLTLLRTFQQCHSAVMPPPRVLLWGIHQRKACLGKIEKIPSLHSRPSLMVVSGFSGPSMSFFRFITGSTVVQHSKVPLCIQRRSLS